MGEASSSPQVAAAASMPGARAERTEDLSNAERGKIVLFNQFCVYFWLVTVHRRMILMLVSYIILVLQHKALGHTLLIRVLA